MLVKEKVSLPPPGAGKLRRCRPGAERAGFRRADGCRGFRRAMQNTLAWTAPAAQGVFSAMGRSRVRYVSGLLPRCGDRRPRWCRSILWERARSSDHAAGFSGQPPPLLRGCAGMESFVAHEREDDAGEYQSPVIADCRHPRDRPVPAAHIDAARGMQPVVSVPSYAPKISTGASRQVVSSDWHSASRVMECGSSYRLKYRAVTILPS